MFTGIITDIGVIEKVEPARGGLRVTIDSAYEPQSIAIGASIACAGCCLTATTVIAGGRGASFTVDVSPESLDKTTLGRWEAGTRINLERSLRAGDELGGHIVTGHVDGRAQLLERIEEEGACVLRFRPPAALLPLIAPKGSVALDGTSLTVNEASDTFTVALIPHTLAVTTWAERVPGEEVNIEVDPLARYVARLADMRLLSR